MESVTTADVDLNTDSPLQAIKVFSFLNSQLFIALQTDGCPNSYSIHGTVPGLKLQFSCILIMAEILMGFLG